MKRFPKNLKEKDLPAICQLHDLSNYDGKAGTYILYQVEDRVWNVHVSPFTQLKLNVSYENGAAPLQTGAKGREKADLKLRSSCSKDCGYIVALFGALLWRYGNMLRRKRK